ncbi:MAG: cation:proton antiporter [Thiogranum sp.]|nr:cation:proton antiporter [Thiogranum sp.]
MSTAGLRGFPTSKVGVPKTLETKIAGESLFNDGTGVVVFLTLLSVVTSGHDASTSEVLTLLAEEVVGGVVVGLVPGYLGYYLLKGIDVFKPNTIKTMTWGGLRGGISVALALSLPQMPERETIVAATYVVVIFSILVQALTMRRLVRRLNRGATLDTPG